MRTLIENLLKKTSIESCFFGTDGNTFINRKIFLSVRLMCVGLVCCVCAGGGDHSFLYYHLFLFHSRVEHGVQCLTSLLSNAIV